MPAAIIGPIIGALGAAASAGVGVMQANKARKQAVEDRERMIVDPYTKTKTDEELANIGKPSANLSLSGRPIVFGQGQQQQPINFAQPRRF